jgi:hypothetical protein
VLKVGSDELGGFSSDASSLLLDLDNDIRSDDNDIRSDDDDDDDDDDNDHDVKNDEDARMDAEGVAVAAGGGFFTALTAGSLAALNHRRRRHRGFGERAWDPIAAFSPATASALPWLQVRAAAEAAGNALAKKKAAAEEKAALIAHDAAASVPALPRTAPLSAEQHARVARNRRAARMQLLETAQLDRAATSGLSQSAHLAASVKPNDRSAFTQDSAFERVAAAPTAASYDLAWMRRDAGVPTFRLNATPLGNAALSVAHARKRRFSFCDLRPTASGDAAPPTKRRPPAQPARA